MKRSVFIILTIAALVLSVAAFTGCGSSSSSGGGSVKVALFANNMYNDYTDMDLGTEVYYMVAELPFMSIEPTTFSGITATAIETAAAGMKYLMIPSQTSDLQSDLDAAARAAIATFVNSGGTLVLFGDSDGYDAALVNAVFGYSITNGIGCTVNVAMFAALDNTDTIFAAGTGEAGGHIPATVPCDTTTGVYWDSDSLPAKGHSIYDSNATEVAVAQINQSKGKIIYIAPSYSTYYDYNHNLIVKAAGLRTNAQVGTPFEVVPVDTLSGVDIEVYGADGVTLLATTTNSMWLPLKKGNYAYIKVTGNGGTPTGAYTAQSGGQCVWGGVCFGSDDTTADDPDKYENNDTKDKATALKDNYYKELFMSTTDVDWFKVIY